MIVASPAIKKYFEHIESETKRAYAVATEARSKGFDPETRVDIPLAANMAERVVGLISIVAPQLAQSNMTQRIKELEAEYGHLDWRVGLKIAEEVAFQKFCPFETRELAMDIAIRVGFAYLTLGIVAAPLEGFIGLKIKKRADGQDYLAIYYAGPVRGAGGTAAATSVLLSDYIRTVMGLAPYDPTEDEINRFVTEVSDYHERVTNLQYRPSDEEVRFLVKHIPVEINGDPTEEIEVSNYKDLKRVETNRIRGGICLVLAEGVAQKCSKMWIRLSAWGKDFKLNWDFLGEFIELQKKIKAQAASAVKTTGDQQLSPNYTFLADLVAGRPILCYPLRNGGFRLRYGRTHTSGFSNMCVHPATLAVLDQYIAIGTQLKTERPGKGATLTICDSIEGPIVKLEDGSVMQLNDPKQIKQLHSPVQEIVYLGDLLISYGDFSENGHKLIPAGYCEEWWVLEVDKAIAAQNVQSAVLTESLHLEPEMLTGILKNPLSIKPSFATARDLSSILKVPLHPAYTFMWNSITPQSLSILHEWTASARLERDGEISKIIPPTPTNTEAKRALELLAVPHRVINNEFVVITDDHAQSFAACLRIGEELRNFSVPPDFKGATIELVQTLAPFPLRDKCGTFIGARMGRPEKAKMRKLAGQPHILFPVGDEGERMRSFQSALKHGKVTAEFAFFICAKCTKETIYPYCLDCKISTERWYVCRDCGPSQKAMCSHGKKHQYKKQAIDIQYYFQKALEHLGISAYPDVIKGVKGTSNEAHTVEHLAKGILRAKHNIFVNKDGTIRYDMTELPLTHFKPKEIGTSIEKLKELGYERDVFGKEIQSIDQILELKPQDIVLPLNENSLEESSKKMLYRVANFIDDLLEKFYKLPRYYNLKAEEDIVGHIVIGLAPHISAGLIGRVIGFTQTQGCFAHPMWHAGLRRDCVFPSTRFMTEDDIGQHYEHIGPYVERLIAEGAHTSSLDPFGTIKVELKKPLFALGVDPTTKKVKRKKIRYFIKGPIEKKWIKITTATNRTLVMTPNHEFLFVDNGVFKFKKAHDITIGDRVPLLLRSDDAEKPVHSLNLVEQFIKYLPEKASKKIALQNKSFFKRLVKIKGRNNLIKYVSKGSLRNLNAWYCNTPLLDVQKLLEAGVISLADIPSDTVLRVRYSSARYPVQLDVTPQLASLLGYYSAEGYCRQNKTVSQVAFRIADLDLQREIILLIKDVFGLEPNLGEESTKITICDQFVYNLFRYCFILGSTAYTKRVPSLLFNTSTKIISSYLSAFIDGDGSIISPNNSVALYSVNRELLDDIAFLFTRFGIFSKFHTTPLRAPGKTVLGIYKRLNKEPKSHILHHLIINGNDAPRLSSILTLKSVHKQRKLTNLYTIKNDRKTMFNGKQYPLEQQSDTVVDYVKKVETLTDSEHSYCMEIEWHTKEDRNVLWGDQILNTRCDGDENAIMLLLDGLLNFSRQYLPNMRGAKTMDSPLVLTSLLIPSEVDDQSHGLDVAWHYPLQLYEAALQYKSAKDVKIDQIKHRLGTEKQYEGFGFTHAVSDLNNGVKCSSYKLIPTMEEKLAGQIRISQRIRAVNPADVARLIIEKHFIKDIKGNLRKFSTQKFRCIQCGEQYRRPPLLGKCMACSGKIIFTVTEGSIVKYLGPSFSLARQFELPPYLVQTLEITRRRIEGVFGKDKEKQSGLGGWT